MLPGVTPARPDDDGRADAALVAAIATGDDAMIRAALLNARLLVPVVAMRAADADAEMAVPMLVAADGSRALPVFSSYDELRAWRQDARPVPMLGARAVAGAHHEEYDGVVLDVAGAHPYTVAGDDLAILAELAADRL